MELLGRHVAFAVEKASWSDVGVAPMKDLRRIRHWKPGAKMESDLGVIWGRSSELLLRWVNEILLQFAKVSFLSLRSR
jgi:hypothetical protein